MQLLDSDVAEFQALYKAHFGKDIDHQTAYERLSKLVRQMEIVYQPITKQQLENLIVGDARKADAKALAELTYDIYREKKAQNNQGKNKTQHFRHCYPLFSFELRFNGLVV